MLPKSVESSLSSLNALKYSGGFGEDELKEVATLLMDRKVLRPLWVFTSRHLANDERGAVDIIEGSGGNVFCDTCMVVSPACLKFNSIAVNSGKAYRYMRTLGGMHTLLLNTEECIEIACTPPSTEQPAEGARR